MAAEEEHECWAESWQQKEEHEWWQSRGSEGRHVNGGQSCGRSWGGFSVMVVVGVFVC